MFHPTLDRHVIAIRQGALASGRYRNDTGNPRYFVTAYFHRPEELAQEISTAGFDSVRVFGVEGPGWLALDFDARWQEESIRKETLHVARLLEEEPFITGISAHLLAVGQRPGMKAEAQVR